MPSGRRPALPASTAARRLRRALAVPVALVTVGFFGMAPAASAATPPRLSVTQAVSPTTFDHAGQVLTWTSVVTDVGSTTLHDLAVTDASSRLPARTCTPVSVGGTLAAGTSTTCTATYTVTQSDLDTHADRADAVTASATTVQGGTTVKATASATATASGSTGLSLTATASPTSISREGQSIAYGFVARNKGDQTLGDLLVRAAFAGSALVCSPVALGGSLAPGASTTCRATRIVALADLRVAALSGTATASGTTKTRAVNATALITVAARALAPRPVEGADVTQSAVSGGPGVILQGSTNDLPGEPGGPGIDPSRTVFVGVGPTDPWGGKQVGGTYQVQNPYGRWSIRPDGSVRFQPYSDQPVGKIDYRVYDTAGHSAVGHLAVTIRKGATCPDRNTQVAHPTALGQPVTFDALSVCDPGQNADGTTGAFDPASVRLVGPSGFGIVLSYDHKHLSIWDDYFNQVGDLLSTQQVGDYTVNADGTVTFAPAPGFGGTVPEVEITADSTAGVPVDVFVDDVQVGAVGQRPLTSTPLTATDDHAETTPGNPVDLAGPSNDPTPSCSLALDQTIFPSDQLKRLPAGSTIGPSGETLTVPGEGVYGAGSWDISFTPAKGFVGDTIPVPYQITDEQGNTARATLTVTVHPQPAARPDSATAAQNHAVTVDVLANDDPGASFTEFSPSYPRLPIHGLPKGWRWSVYRNTLTVPGQGAYVVNPGNQAVTFTPEPQFSGTTTPLTLDLGVYEHLGQVVFGHEVTSTLTITVTRSTPHAVDDTATTGVGRPVVVPVLTNDSAGPGASLVGSSVRLRLAPGLPSGSALYGDAKTLTVPGRGAFLVAGDGEITFVPIGSKPGPAPVIGYQVADTNGTTTRANVNVTVR